MPRSAFNAIHALNGCFAPVCGVRLVGYACLYSRKSLNQQTFRAPLQISTVKRRLVRHALEHASLDAPVRRRGHVLASTLKRCRISWLYCDGESHSDKNKTPQNATSISVYVEPRTSTAYSVWCVKMNNVR